MTRKKQPSKKLTPRRERFAQEVVINGGNAKKAAEAAGLSTGHSAEVQGSRLMRNVEVLARVNELRAELQLQSDIRTEDILGTLAFHLRGDMADLVPDDPFLQRAKLAGFSRLVKKYKVTERRIPQRGLDANGVRLPDEIEIRREFELHDPQKAAATLAEILGLKSQPRKNPLEEEERKAWALEQIERTMAEFGVDAIEARRMFLLRVPEAKGYLM